jgi:hypothetical protein
MYQKVFESYVRYEQSRGISFRIARDRGIYRFTFLALLNCAAVMYVIDLAGGPHIPNYIAEHAWVLALFAITLLAIHIGIGHAMQQSPKPQLVAQETVYSRGRFSWAWYVAATLFAWVLTCGVVIVHLTH